MVFAASRASILRHIRNPVPRNLALNRYYSFFSPTLYPTEEEIVAASLDVIQATPKIKSAKTALEFTMTHRKVKNYSFPDKVRVACRVLDVVNTYPQLDPRQVFKFRLMFRSGLSQYESDKDLKDLTRDEVTSKVVEIIKICPNVDPSKVTKDTHFEQDLGMDPTDRYDIVLGIRTMFMIDISDNIASDLETVKDAVDYVCSHLHETDQLMKKAQLIH